MSFLPSLLPLKKRAINDSTSGGDSSIPDPDDSRSSSPKKKTRANDGSAVAASEDAAGAALEAPAVPRHRRRPAPAVAAASARADALSAAEMWLKKGEWVVTDHQASPVATPPPAKTKLMHDGIRSFTAAAARADEKKKKKKVAAGAAGLSEALRLRLAELGATRPWFVYRKALQKSDVCPNQNRLLVSCKRETLEGCPITPIFSAREWARVENKDAGLLVTALDARGKDHALTCKFLDSNGGYRFIAEWKKFLCQNGVSLDSRGRWTRSVDVEVLAFRSRALKRQPTVDAAGRLDKEKKVEEHLHPDGSLGLILLLHEHAGRRRGEEEEDDGDYGEGMRSPPPVAREKKGNKKEREKRDAEVGGAEASMSKVEMDSKYGEAMSNMAVGIIMLRDTISKEKESQKDNVVVEGNAAVVKEEESLDDVMGGAVSKEKAESRENVEGDAILKEESRDNNVEGGGAISVKGDTNLKVESRGNVEELGAISEERRDSLDDEGADMKLN
ncbi:unnamed protein product [Urochloa humidicola]